MDGGGRISAKSAKLPLVARRSKADRGGERSFAADTANGSNAQNAAISKLDLKDAIRNFRLNSLLGHKCSSKIRGCKATL